LRLEDVLEQPRDPLLTSREQGEDNSAPTRLSGQIEIKDLRYGFTAITPPLIDGLTLTIHAGMRLALVGGSGSGKSTLAKLLAGLHQPTAGTILFDGKTLLELPRAVVVSSLAMVQQEIQLFGCSVRDNLSLWNHAIPESTLLEACRDVEMLDVVRGLPDGIDTLLSEGGRNLSGGQRQRLELARALVGNPSILIMDEATSALDAETEQKLIANLSRRGCTQVIVAHRLSTIRDADLILVMDQGRVIQQGTHERLMQDPSGVYFQLFSEVS
jgi:ABC-type bacteriocin/lantibiotic exporter with double-glycine peptidase domain